MKIDISKLIANPFRDFELDPIEDAHVERLMASADDLGLWAAIPARKRGDIYEIACHHHLLEAASRLNKLGRDGFDRVEVIVEPYSDNDMRRIMAVENLTQRGANTGAQLDAVNAFAYQVAYEVLTDRTTRETFVSRMTTAARAASRASVLKDGPGDRLIYQAINGFHMDEHMDRKEGDDKAIMIEIRDVRNAVKALKESGRMATIVAKAYAVVEQERAEDATKAAEIEAKAKVKAEEAERKAAEEIKRRQEAEAAATRHAEEQRKASEAARVAAEKASAERKVEADRKAAEAKAAMEKAQKEREASAAARRKAEEEAAARRKVEFDRQAALLKEAEQRQKKEAEEKAKVKAQVEQEKIYDIRCNDLFPNPEHAERFRLTITSRGAREEIKKEDQYAIAQSIAKGMADWKKHYNQTVGIEYISDSIKEFMAEQQAELRKAEEAREAAMRAVNARLRVNKLWGTVGHHAFAIERAMQDLVKEHQMWDVGRDGDFPVNVDIVNTYGILGKLEEMMKRMFGGRFGLPTDDDDDDDGEPPLKQISNS